MRGIKYIKTALTDYKVGAFTPSSRFVIRRIRRELGAGRKYIVEYGAGDGVVTRELLRHLPAGGKVVAIELNSKFLAELRTIKDPRLIVVAGDVTVISRTLKKIGVPRIDAVLSSIPFTFFPPRIRERVVRDTARALAPDGIFLIYQYSLLMRSLLKKYFAKIDLQLEPRNFLPMFFMVARKKKKPRIQAR
ncbi:MAG: methyltransferase domain-containing protein [bacterium]|nr:methyltransferase domain-containing protein [bacterium]MDZ4299888.1 methyltransferase domain-containing protein [Candidatus Sungbacteria bacterium]